MQSLKNRCNGFVAFVYKIVYLSLQTYCEGLFICLLASTKQLLDHWERFPKGLCRQLHSQILLSTLLLYFCTE